MLYVQDIETCLADVIGAGGIERGRLSEKLDTLPLALEDLNRARTDGSLPLLGLPSRTEDLAAIRDTAARYRDSFDDVMVLGTGGSSLGGGTLVALAAAGNAPRVHFLDNVDPDGFADMLAPIELKRAGALIISKSGTTAETIAQALALLPAMADAVGEGALPRHVTVITEPPKSSGPQTPMRRIAENLGLPTLDHDPGIGGRYAAMTNVGLLPAAIAGLDPVAVRAGATEALDATLSAGIPVEAPPALGAALAVAGAEAGLGATVLMPYLDRLKPLAMWYRQLWAESLGKDGNGTTPLAAHGTVDQHSQLQLWLGGPADKLYTLICGDVAGTGSRLDTEPAAGEDIDYLAGCSLGDLLEAEQQATLDTLVHHHRPVRSLRIGRPDAATVGALMMHFMLETILTAHLLAVDPFDQPAVEEGKVLARHALAAMGAKRGGTP